MRYVVEDATHGAGAYVYDTLKNQMVMAWNAHHLAAEMADDLNAIHEKYPQSAPIPAETVNRLESQVMNDEATARWWAQEAKELMAKGREREAQVKSKKANAAATHARDIRIALKALGVVF